MNWYRHSQGLRHRRLRFLRFEEAHAGVPRIHWEMLTSLVVRWEAIERIAAALLRDCLLTGRRVRVLALAIDTTAPRSRKDAAGIRGSRPR